MSLRFYEIDLNSGVVTADRNDELHVANTSETTFGAGVSESETLTDGPLGAETGEIEKKNGSKVDNTPVDGGEISMNDDVVLLGLRGEVRDTDAYGGDSTCSEKNMKNFSAFSEGTVADKSGESEGKLNTEVGGTVNFDLVYGDTISIPTEDASCSFYGGLKPVSPWDSKGADELWNENSHSIIADGDWKSASEMEKEVTEIKGDIDIVTRLADDIAPRINGCSSNVKQAALKLESQVNELWPEKGGQFQVSDLVWGKVRSHPWWPGQIFDPSDSSEKARRFCKNDSFLIAYFGDQTFAWNEASQIKPFWMCFSQMEKQSNTEAFCRAVNCALEEVSRRVEFGLACSCLSEEVYDNIKTQIVVNAGIREESSIRDCVDEYSSNVSSFMPVKIVQYLKALAHSPYGEIDRLELVIARAQLLAFNRWKGIYWLPDFKVLGGLLDDAEYEQFQLGKGKLHVQDTSSQKRKEISGDVLFPSKKKRRMSDLMSNSHSKLSNGDNEPVGRVLRNLTSSSSINKRKAPNSVPDDDSSEKNRKASLSPVSKKQFSRVGESIRRVASQLTTWTPILKDYSEKACNKRSSGTNSEKFQRRKVIPVQYLPPNELLSQLYMASIDPMNGYKFLTSSVSFFSNFRNSFCLENSTLRENTKSTRKVSSKQIAKKLFNLDPSETYGFEGWEDSYWTDRIVQTNTEEQVLFEPEITNGNGSLPIEPKTALELGQESDSKQVTGIVNVGSDRMPTDCMNEQFEEEHTPTALILNFTDLESVPSESNLNKIFSRYGPLNESGTEVLTKSKRAKVIFKRRSDAETAFSSSGKFSTFGPSLVSYRLHYLPSSRKTSPFAKKRSKKSATSVEGNAA
ncbi:hypothetical protein U1Q18_040412 [Sarracenia purpurea var. burkii]